MTTSATSSAHPAARILVVDDEDRVREGLCWSLRMSGYQVDGAESGAQALSMMVRNEFDLMLLDMNMPVMDGIAVMEQARQVQPDLAIVVLTGHATLDSAIAAVKLGASDYLLKPASIPNLQAAVAKALTARADLLRQQRAVALMDQIAEVLHPPELEKMATAAGQETVHVLTAGGLTLDAAKRVAVIEDPDARTAELTEAETAILQELMRHADQVRTCRQLVRAAWGYDMSEAEAASVVRSHIFRLRKKIEPDPASPRFVKTVRGGGYYLAGGS